MPIKSVVFDYGSVLAWPPSSISCSSVAATAGIPASVLVKRYYTERMDYDRDNISNLEYWKRLTRDYPASDDRELLHKLAKLDVEIWSEINHATVDWLPALKKAGFILAILSNMPESFCSALEDTQSWLDSFDFRIFSGRVKLNKPEPEIYRLLLETLSGRYGRIRPEEVLFLDDLEKNIDGARNLGINAELYNVFTGGLSEIAGKYGLPLPDELPPPESRLLDTACSPHRYFRS